MIVDDSAPMRAIIRDTVAEYDDEIFEYENGLLAVTAYSTVHPDLVLMDLLMDEMDGLTATKRIRESFPGAHIIIVTNYDGAPFRKEASSIGVKAYVLKEQLDMLPPLMMRKKNIQKEYKNKQSEQHRAGS